MVQNKETMKEALLMCFWNFNVFLPANKIQTLNDRYFGESQANESHYLTTFLSIHPTDIEHLLRH